MLEKRKFCSKENKVKTFYTNTGKTKANLIEMSRDL